MIINNTVVFLYECPECKFKFGDGQTRHQHPNGEWIDTSTIKAWYQMHRWDELLKAQVAAQKNPGE